MTLTVASMVQQLYTTIYAMPLMPENVACTLELGPHYTLTFYQKQKTLVTVLAERDGCRKVSLSGEPHSRTAMDKKEFWNQLDRAIYEATPAAKVNQLALMSTSSHAQPPQTARISSPDAAQHIYNAILALPLVTENVGYSDGNPDYQLIFHTADQVIAASVDLRQNLVSLNGALSSHGGMYRINEQFKQLFAKTLAGVVFTPAQPDRLLLQLETSKSNGQSIRVTDMQLMRKLFGRLFTFPVAQPPSEDCLGSDKVAGKQKWYFLTYSQWDLVILQVSAYEASCTFVEKNFNSGQSQYLQADQEFWLLIYQAAGQ